MSYNPSIDFVALARLTTGGIVNERMPGLDFVLAALARAGVFSVFVGQTQPSTNQAATAWLKPALPSWTAESAVFLWDAASASYQPATAALWTALISATFGFIAGYNFQSAPLASNVIAPLRSLVAVQRVAPVSTALLLPAITSQLGKPIQIADMSTAVISHTLVLLPATGNTVMGQPFWQLLSSADQLAAAMLTPSTDLNAWIVS